jgi:hypothetical protein
MWPLLPEIVPVPATVTALFTVPPFQEKAPAVIGPPVTVAPQPFSPMLREKDASVTGGTSVTSMQAELELMLAESPAPWPGTPAGDQLAWSVQALLVPWPTQV